MDRYLHHNLLSLNPALFLPCSYGLIIGMDHELDICKLKCISVESFIYFFPFSKESMAWEELEHNANVLYFPDISVKGGQ